MKLTLSTVIKTSVFASLVVLVFALISVLERESRVGREGSFDYQSEQVCSFSTENVVGLATETVQPSVPTPARGLRKQTERRVETEQSESLGGYAQLLCSSVPPLDWAKCTLYHFSSRTKFHCADYIKFGILII